MDKHQSRSLQEAQYRAYISILDEKGIFFDTLDDALLKALTDAELSRLVRTVRDLARTPVK